MLEVWSRPVAVGLRSLGFGAGLVVGTRSRRCSGTPPTLVAVGLRSLGGFGARGRAAASADRGGARAAQAEGWANWTNKKAKTHEDYGMTQEAFATQELTPHGKTLVPPLGRHARAAWAKDGLDVACDELATPDRMPLARRPLRTSSSTEDWA